MSRAIASQCARWAKVKQGQVIHRPELAEWPHYIGSDQVRNFRVESDRLIPRLKKPSQTGDGVSRESLAAGKWAELLTAPSCSPNMSSQWPLRRNPWGKQFLTTAYSARSGAGAWVWCMRQKTSSWAVMSL